MQTELDASQPDLPGYVIRHPLDGVQRGWLATEVETGERCVVRCVSSRALTLADVDGELPHRIVVRDIRRVDRAGELLVVEELVEGRMLGDVLRDVALSPGQIVTLLIPLLETCAALAQLSWKPVLLELSDVLVDTTGRARIANDVTLTATATGSASVEELTAIAAVLARLPVAIDANGLSIDQLVGHLLANYEPQPIEIECGSAARHSLPIRLSPVELQAELGAMSFVETAQRGFRAMIQRATNAVHNLVTRRVPNQRIRTLGFSIALAAALVGIAFLAIPSPQSDSAAGATGALSSATDQPVEPVSNSSTPASKLGDPALAVLSLVAFRATCVTGQAYAECLNQTDEIGSPQFQEDDERLKLAQALRFSAVSGASAELVSLMGKAALVRVRVENATASVLLVQTEAGWRIRELFD